MTLQYDRQITISIGTSRKATTWQASPMTVSAFYERFSTPIRGVETLTAYLSMKKSQQDELKDVGGFVGGALSGPRRKAANVTGRDVVTLDFDTIPPYGTGGVLAGVDNLGVSALVYSTRKHRDEAPRLRVVIPAGRTMTVDEHEAVARRLAEDIGISWADPTTFEASRLMYWPSCSADGAYICKVYDKPLLDVDIVLQKYRDWHDTTSWPRVPGEVSYQKLAAKQGDPETKPGVVGAFCRVYDIFKALDELIPGLYEPVDNDDNRFTYLGGSTTGGAVVYDHGKFLFSHHATDPCSGRLVNAFDLVRLHKFGDMDDEAAPNTPINRLPSFTAMSELAVADKAVAALIAQERLRDAQREFSDRVVIDTTPTIDDPDTPGDQPPQMEWMQRLRVNPQTAAILPTIDNICIILECDPLLAGKFALNAFSDLYQVLAPLPWNTDKGDRTWTDADDSGLYWYMEKVYNITKRGNIDAAFSLFTSQHAINPVQDYLKKLVWDGKPRLDTLFIDYLGAEDNSYTRAVTRKSFTAAVTRAMDPGCKYDHMPIICGPQGIGKSTLLGTMAGAWFSDSIRTFEGKEASELLQGVWLVEIAELQAFGKSDVDRIKQVLSSRSDRFRAAYGRRAVEHQRRCVFFGTCNPQTFLRDPTGGRRFWPIYTGKQEPTKNVFSDLPNERDQLWAEAKVRWQMGEELFLSGELAVAAREIQESAREVDEREGVIEDFLEKPIPVDWQKWSLDRRRDFWAGGVQTTEPIKLVERDRVCALEIWTELFQENKRSLDQRNSRAINSILERLPGWERNPEPVRFGPHGPQRGYTRKR